MHIRKATSSDAPAVAGIYLASRKALVAFAPLTHDDDEVREWIADTLIPDGGVWVAEKDHEILGMMAISKQDGASWIDHLYLNPASTSQGIGTHLLEHAKSLLNSPIRLYTFQKNAASRKFYEENGFVAIHFSDGAENEEHCPDVLYQWTDVSTEEDAPDDDLALDDVTAEDE
jgi:GNAT superfamily N-acetyltransferase